MRGLRSTLRTAVLVAVGSLLLPASAWANFSDCFIELPLLGFDSEGLPGGPVGTHACRVELPLAGQPTNPTGGTAYLDAQHSFRTIQDAPIGAQPTALPFQRSRVELHLEGAPLDSSGAFGAGGINIEQPFTGTHALGATQAQARIEVDTTLVITLDPDPNAIWEGFLGINIGTSATGFTQFGISVDSLGNTSVPAGFTLTDLGGNVFEISGTAVSDPFQALVDGSPDSFFVVVFGQGTVDPFGGSSISTGTIIIDSSNTAISRIVSLDPNASFTLGNPLVSPEPAAMLLMLAAGGTALLLARGRSRH